MYVRIHKKCIKNLYTNDSLIHSLVCLVIMKCVGVRGVNWQNKRLEYRSYAFVPAKSQ